MVTDTKHTELENGLRILARMIARAHLKEARTGQPEPDDTENKETEGDNANQRSKRGREAPPAGEDQAGGQGSRC